jgi:glutamate/tyrosine decarboxylase-like PLP-dependent enzyme
MNPEPDLQLSVEEMRRLGYRMVDILVAHFESLREKKVTRVESRDALRAIFEEPLPEQGSDPAALLDFLEREVFTRVMHLDHPRFFGFIPGPSNFVSVLAEALASGHNVFAGTWLEASAPAAIELQVVDWLRQLVGAPETAGGLFVSGGTMANLTGLAVARRNRRAVPDAVVYSSDQTHYSIARAMRILGFSNDSLRKLDSDSAFRLPLESLERAIAADRAAGRTPFLVVANAGTTNTGAVDPLREIAGICRRENLWLHVDGAYGASAALTTRGKKALDGIELADSLSLDPHKWLFQPYEAGCVLVRERRHLEETFRAAPEYLKDTARNPEDEEVNFSDLGPQGTRSFRALKLWLSMKTFGLERFRQAIDRGLDLAEWTESYLRRSASWEVASPASLGIVCFRCHREGLSEARLEELHRSLVAALIGDGTAMVSSTELRGKTVLHVCLINPRTTEDDVRKTLARLEELAGRGAMRQ